MSDKSIIVNIFNPAPDSTADSLASALKRAAEETEPASQPIAIAGVKVIECDEGQRIEVAPELQKLLVAHGWLPPVDGQ